MSPILVRPVREQFEHDRVIRVLQAKYKRKYDVAINPGAEQNASVGIGDLTMYPDLVLFSQERIRKIQGTVEVETTESVNTLEAMAEWGPFSRLRTPFFLYVPANSIDTVRRLCSEHAIDPAEIWTYHTALDQLRFTMVHRSSNAPKGSISEHKPKPPVPVAVTTPEPAAASPVKSVAKPAPKAAKPEPEKARPEKPKAAHSTPEKAKAPARPTAPKSTPAKNSKPTGKSANAGRSVKSVKSVKPAKSAKSAKSADSRKSAKSAKSAKSKRR